MWKDGKTVFNASLIYECLTSVPFSAGVATSFIQYYNDTIQFQSTLEYLKDPPTSYQQPGIDLVGGLAHLQSGVNNGAFQNQYVNIPQQICTRLIHKFRRFLCCALKQSLFSSFSSRITTKQAILTT